jgi:hypothetical protein
LAFFRQQRFFYEAAMANSKTIQSAPEAAGKPVTDEAILKVAKEIVVKFIEVGRLTPTNIGETFQDVYKAVWDTVRS